MRSGPPADPSPGGPDPVAWWALTRYRSFLAGALVGALGSWMLRTAQLLLVIELTDGNGLIVGVVTALQYLPTFVLSAAVGVRADRAAKAGLLFVGQLVMIAAAAAQAVLLFAGIDTWVAIAVLAAAFGVGAAIDGPMRTAVLPDLVPAERVPRAVGVNVVLLQLGRFTGPLLTALLVVQTSYAWAFTVAGLLLAVFAAILPRLSVPPDIGADARPGGVGEALTYLRRRPRILGAFALVGVGGILGPNLVSFSGIIVHREFGGGAEEIAVAATAIAAGAVAGSLFAARFPGRGVTAVAVMTLFVGVGSAAVAAMPEFVPFLIVLAVAGGVALAMVSRATALVQSLVDDEVRGRVTGLYFIVLVGGAPLGAPLVGALGDLIGIRTAIAVAGGLVAAVALVVPWTVRRAVRRQEEGEESG